MDFRKFLPLILPKSEIMLTELLRCKTFFWHSFSPFSEPYLRKMRFQKEEFQRLKSQNQTN